jgi:gas vesicle protein
VRRILAFIGGVLSGGAFGTAVALLFTPASGDSMRGGLRQRMATVREAGADAAARKRAELEAQLDAMTTPQQPTREGEEAGG